MQARLGRAVLRAEQERKTPAGQRPGDRPDRHGERGRAGCAPPRESRMSHAIVRPRAGELRREDRREHAARICERLVQAVRVDIARQVDGVRTESLQNENVDVGVDRDHRQEGADALARRPRSFHNA